MDPVGVHDVGEGLRRSIAEEDVDAGRAEIVLDSPPSQAVSGGVDQP
jgi:hypothetical protein